MQSKGLLRGTAGRMVGLLLVVGLFGTAHAQFGGFFNGNKRDKPIDVSSYPANIQQGYRVFKNKCLECHTLNRGLRVTQTSAMAKYWVLQMQAMPAADFNDRQAMEIVDFIDYYQSHLPNGNQTKTSSGMTTAPIDKVDVHAGKDLFSSMMCTLCHTTDVSNDPRIVSLAGVGSSLSREQILDILSGGKGSLGMPALPTSTSQNDLHNLLAYLQSLQKQ